MPASSDGVVSTTLLSDNTTQRITVDWSVAGSPISGTAGNVSTTTVTEQTNGYTVRSLTAVVAPGGSAVGVDHEAPFSSSLSYVARAYSVTGALLATSTAAAVTSPSPASGFATWLKSLSTPSLSVTVSTVSAPEWTGGIAQSPIWVIGRADPIVVQDVRQYESASLDVYTDTDTATAALKALLRTPGPYLLQLPGLSTVDRYVTVGPYTRKHLDPYAPIQLRAWTLPLQEVARPNPIGWQVADPGRTYADSTAAYPLYSNRTGTYRTKS